MNENFITQYIKNTFDGINVDTAMGATFFSCDPERKLPFATIVTEDNPYDSASNLNREGVFRLNVRLGNEAFHRLFSDAAVDADNFDYTALDRIMPHPIYGKMSWICVLNPSEATFQRLQPLLADAYERAVAKQAQRKASI